MEDIGIAYFTNPAAEAELSGKEIDGIMTYCMQEMYLLEKLILTKKYQ